MLRALADFTWRPGATSCVIRFCLRSGPSAGILTASPAQNALFDEQYESDLRRRCLIHRC